MSLIPYEIPSFYHYLPALLLPDLNGGKCSYSSVLKSEDLHKEKILVINNASTFPRKL